MAQTSRSQRGSIPLDDSGKPVLGLAVLNANGTVTILPATAEDNGDGTAKLLVKVEGITLQAEEANLDVNLDITDDEVLIGGTPDGGTTRVFVKTDGDGRVENTHLVEDAAEVISSIDTTGEAIDVTGTVSVLFINTGTDQLLVGKDTDTALIPLLKANLDGGDFTFLHSYEAATAGLTSYFVKASSGSAGEVTIVRRMVA